MKISNKQTKITEGIKLNEKDIMTKLITYLKDIEKNYTVALTESSNEYLYKKIQKQFDLINKYQRQTYSLMFQNGWYSLETAEKTKTKECYQNLKTLLENNIKRPN